MQATKAGEILYKTLSERNYYKFSATKKGIITSPSQTISVWFQPGITIRYQGRDRIQQSGLDEEKEGKDACLPSS